MDDSTPIIDVTSHPADFVPTDDFWAFLRRRKVSIGFFWIVGLALAFWWLLSRPALFQAESRVMIVRTGSGGAVSEAELASEIELIRDPSHLDKTAARQAINQSDAQIHQNQQKISAGLTVEPAGNSNLVAIQYRDVDPTAAARVVNQLVDLYLADRRFIFQTSPRPASDSGAPAQELLSAFDAVNHGPLLRSELQSRVQQRLELEARLGELKAQVRDRQEAVRVLRKRLGTLPERIHSATSTRVTSRPASKQTEETEILNPMRQQIDSEILNNEAAQAGLEARLDQMATALREARTAEDRTSALSSERDRIERRAQEARGINAAEAGNIGDRPNLRATLVNRAEPPYGPMPRHTAWWTIAAAVATLLAALLIAWLIDQIDRPIFTSGDFERASGAPQMGNFARGAGA